MASRILLLIMSLMILTTQAFAVSGEGLKKAFDEFNYAVSVEWDQKDQEFYNKELQKLSATVKELQAQGLSNSDLLEFVLEQTKNESLRKDLSLIYAQIQINKMSQADALKLVNETMKKSYSQGASWSGVADKVLIGLVALLVVAWTVAYVNCISDPNHVTVCSENYVCSSSWDSYGSDCYYETSCGCSH